MLVRYLVLGNERVNRIIIKKKEDETPMPIEHEEEEEEYVEDWDFLDYE